MKKTTGTYSFNGFAVLAQTKEEQTIKIYKSSLTNSKCYAWLDDLSNKIGSVYQDLPVPKAVLYTKAQLETLGIVYIFRK
jgi:two-component SAPR family response regulator